MGVLIKPSLAHKIFFFFLKSKNIIFQPPFPRFLLCFGLYAILFFLFQMYSGVHPRVSQHSYNQVFKKTELREL